MNTTATQPPRCAPAAAADIGIRDIAADAVLTLVVTPGLTVDASWTEDEAPSSQRRIVVDCGGATDPLAGLRSVLRAVLPGVPPARVQAYGAEIRTLLPQDGAGQGTLSLADIALPASERRLSRESERSFRLVSSLAALLGSVARPGSEWQLLVPDLMRADRLTLHLVHQLRRFAHPGVNLAAGLAQAELDALAALPAGGDLGEAAQVRRRFLHDLLSLGRHAVRHRPARSAPGQAAQLDRRAFTEPGMADLIEWGEYEQALQALEGEDEEDFARCKARGLVHAYLGQFALANDCYVRAAAVAGTAVERAQAQLYQALLASKRKGQHARAQLLIAAGRDCLEGVQGDEALVEQGWLSNVDALTRFSSGHYVEAMSLCKDAYAMLRRCRGSDALHLKINLVSNLSVVCESMGRPLEALAVWQNFEQFLRGGAAPLFAKIYHYRVAGLQWRAGQPAEAEAAYRRSYDEAAQVYDRFHLSYIAFDLAVLAAQRGDGAAAQGWLDSSAEHASAVADHDRVAALLAARAGLGTHTAEAREPLPPALRVLPGSKLGRPFHLMHIPPLTPPTVPAAERAS
jgi:tetratricopeptide (TPR) repeat protein